MKETMLNSCCIICSIFNLLTFLSSNLMSDRITCYISGRLNSISFSFLFFNYENLYFSVNWIVTLLLYSNRFDGKDGVVLHIIVLRYIIIIRY